LPPAHTALAQSEAARQAFPEGHAPQVPPPQSTSVSELLRWPSVQLACSHFQFRQTVLAQLPSTLHDLPEPQAGQTPFPQSTSVSVPFFTPSVQVGAWHALPVQMPL
jgi:hypothetical protein